MAIFASTTTSGYSDPLKALSIKALEQRQKDMQAQMAAQQDNPATMATIPGGIGHVLGVVGDQMKEARTMQAVAAQKDELARTIAGMNQENPDPQHLAKLAVLAPDMHKEVVQQLAESRRQKAQIASTEGLQQGSQAFQSGEKKLDRTQTAELATQQQDFTRGQTDRQIQATRDLATQQQRASADLAAAERNLKVSEGALERAAKSGDQNTMIEAQKNLEEAKAGHAVALANVNNASTEKVATAGNVSAEKRTEGTNVTSAANVAAQNASAERIATQKANQPQSQLGQLYSDAQNPALNISPESVKAAASKLTSPDHNMLTAKSTAGNTYKNLSQSVDKLDRALQLVSDGVNTGYWSDAKTKAAQIAEGRWGTDKDAADRTAEFNRIMSSEAIQQMAQQLKGQTTNFEMEKFVTIVNDPNATPQQRVAAIKQAIAGAEADKQLHADTYKAAGGNTGDIDKTLATGRLGAPRPEGMSRGDIISEAKAALSNPATSPEQAAAIKGRLKSWNLGGHL